MGDSPEAIPPRLARGETADVVILDGGAADELGRRGLVRAGSKVELARSLIGMVVRAGAAKPDIGSVEAFRSTLLAAKSIAYSDSGSGTYLSTTMFQKLGIADQVAGKSRKVRGPPSGEPVAAVVARGEVEIGFQQVSELLHVPGVTFVGAIPAELQPGLVVAMGRRAAARISIEVRIPVKARSRMRSVHCRATRRAKGSRKPHTPFRWPLPAPLHQWPRHGRGCG